MALTRTQNNSYGVLNLASGSLLGTYTAADFTINVGFIPKYVKIVNVTDRITQEWWDGMNTGDYLKTIANGTVSLETNDALSVDTAGVGDQDGAGTGSATSIPGTKGTGLISVDISDAGIGDNDTVVWMAIG